MVRVGVIEGEYHWHKHDDDDEFFYVVEGKLLIDLEDRMVELITSRVLGAAAVIPGVIALPTVLFGLMLISGDPPPQTRTIQSPTGQQAHLIYQAGYLGRDHTEVRLKHTGCCRHEIVFWHAGPSGFADPKIEWLDNRSLRITYHARPDDPQHCKKQVKDIVITCVAKPWEN